MAVSNALSYHVQLLPLVGERLRPPFQNRLFRAWKVNVSTPVPRISVVRSNRLLVSVRARVLTPFEFQDRPPLRNRQSVAASTPIWLPAENWLPPLAETDSSVKRSRASGWVPETRSSAKRAVFGRLVQLLLDCSCTNS